MKRYLHIKQEQDAAIAFNKQSSKFDSLYGSNTIVTYKRNRVREHVFKFLAPESNILELNAGTGDDAIYFAGEGHNIHATDVSVGMQGMLRKKIQEKGVAEKISTELCSYTSLESLKYKGPFDLIFSNFAGLNCSQELDSVLKSFEPLLKPGGVVTLVILPKFCLWESLLVFKGKFKTAFRRLFSKGGRRSHIEGEYFKCWYYNPKQVITVLKQSFTLLSIEGLCVFVPPSYIEQFAEKYPRVYKYLLKKESFLKSKWPWKYIGDYYIISLKKNK